MIIFILLSGTKPFRDKDQPRLFRKIKTGTFEFHEKLWRDVSLDAKVKAGFFYVANINMIVM